MRVFTFYSFKGGVGRSALMFHLGVHWADRGRVVALVDMDLHAPGISYHPWLEQPDKDNPYHKLGVSDLLATFYATRDVDNKNFQFFPPSRCLREIKPEGSNGKWGSNGRLLVLPAGDVTIPQMQMVQEESIAIPAAVESRDESPEQQAMRAFSKKFLKDFESFRLDDHPRKAGIDYLLIDCRTGYPELAELTMGYMADRLVLVSGLNQQNLRGLSITLKKLRPQRIPFGSFATDALVAFSPVPAHVFEDAEARKALEAGVKVLERNRLPNRDDEPSETLPPFFTLPYSPHLAVSDEPISRKRLMGKLHPYWEAVEKIAETLDPRESITESAQEISKQTRETVGLNLMGKDAGQETDASGERNAGDTSKPMRGSLAPIMRLPKWHWPLANDPIAIQSWRDKLPIDRDLEERREQLLDGLCASISLTIDEKGKIIEKWSELSQFQVDSQVETFQAEKLKYSTLSGEHGPQLISLLFQHQQAWAMFMLGEERGRQAMLLRPLREPELFASWKTHAFYWHLLADALEQVPAYPEESATARQKAYDLALDNPWESIAILEEERYVTQELVAGMLDRILAQPLPDDWARCHALCNNVLNLWNGAMAGKITPLVDHLRGLALNEKNCLFHNMLGNLLQDHLKEYQEAEAAYRQAIAIDPKSVYAWNVLGNLLQDHFDRYTESEAAYRQAIALDPKYVYAWYNLGRLLQEYFDRYTESEAAYRQAIAINPKYVNAWNGLGLLYRDRLGRCQEALDHFAQGLAVDPNHPYLLMNQGHLHLLLGQDWQEELTRALTNFEGEKGLGAIVNRIRLSLGLGDEGRLPREDEMADALSRWGHDPYLHTMVAMCALAQQREVHSHLEQAVALLKSHGDHLNLISGWYQLAEARPDLREAARQAAAFYFHLAPEHRARFKDPPQPALLERYRDFVEGRSHGAGDPRDRHHFCHDAAPG